MRTRGRERGEGGSGGRKSDGELRRGSDKDGMSLGGMSLGKWGEGGGASEGVEI